MRQKQAYARENEVCGGETQAVVLSYHKKTLHSDKELGVTEYVCSNIIHYVWEFWVSNALQKYNSASPTFANPKRGI